MHNRRFCASIKELYEIRQWECETQSIILNSTTTLQNLNKSPLQILLKIICKITFYPKLIFTCNRLKVFLERATRASFFAVKNAKEDNDHCKTEVMEPFTQIVSFSFFLQFKNISPCFFLSRWLYNVDPKALKQFRNPSFPVPPLKH